MYTLKLVWSGEAVFERGPRAHTAVRLVTRKLFFHHCGQTCLGVPTPLLLGESGLVSERGHSETKPNDLIFGLLLVPISAQESKTV